MAAPEEEGQEMTCKSCGTELIAREKKYEGFDSKLQWQNEDGTAHYKFAGPGKFKCNIPKSEEQKHDDAVNIAPQRKPATLEYHPPGSTAELGNVVVPSNKVIADDMKLLHEKLDNLKEMVSEVIRMLADQKLEQMEKQ